MIDKPHIDVLRADLLGRPLLVAEVDVWAPQHIEVIVAHTLDELLADARAEGLTPVYTCIMPRFPSLSVGVGVGAVREESPVTPEEIREMNAMFGTEYDEDDPDPGQGLNTWDDYNRFLESLTEDGLREWASLV